MDCSRFRAAGGLARLRWRSKQFEGGRDGDEAAEKGDDARALNPQSAIDAAREDLQIGTQHGEIGFRRQFIPVGSGGLAQRFGVRFGLAAFDACRFESAGGGERVEGDGSYGKCSG